MRFADDKIQICHPIITGFTADYEEQVVITNMKFGV